jgi:molecular chaperone DnaK (HSP70)
MVGLMQEPVAAAMSVMRKRKSDGIFVVYDLGGGTLDVAIAQFRARADQFWPPGAQLHVNPIVGTAQTD